MLNFALFKLNVSEYNHNILINIYDSKGVYMHINFNINKLMTFYLDILTSMPLTINDLPF